FFFFFFCNHIIDVFFFFFFQAEDGIRDFHVTGVQTCALPICGARQRSGEAGERGERHRPNTLPGHAHLPAVRRQTATPQQTYETPAGLPRSGRNTPMSIKTRQGDRTPPAAGDRRSCAGCPRCPRRSAAWAPRGRAARSRTPSSSRSRRGSGTSPPP